MIPAPPSDDLGKLSRVVAANADNLASLLQGRDLGAHGGHCSSESKHDELRKWNPQKNPSNGN